MNLFDSHCHLNLGDYKKDLPDVVTRAEQAGVRAMMIVGITLEQSRKAVALAERFLSCYASVGIHPHDARSASSQDLEELKSLARHSKVAAWGETGLDYNRMHSPRADQEKWFVRQLDAAEELNLPLIFHERDSEGRFLEILSLRKPPPQGVVHCFSGSPEELSAYLDMGLYIGITGIITLKGRGRDLRRMAPLIPPEQVVIETDAPFLTPAPEKNRCRRNEPAFVRTILDKLARVLDREPETFADLIWDNTCRLYGIADVLRPEMS
jgi:TatD DNase family protein